MITHGAALNRWRLVLGKNADASVSLADRRLMRMDDALDFLYNREAGPDVRRDADGGQEESQPAVVRWLSEVRELFPQETAEILQRHALDRYQLTALLTDREVLERMEPDESLLETILSLKGMMKGPVLDAARRIVERVVAQLTAKMQQDIRRSALGKLDRAARSAVPSLRNLDVKRTIRKNLAHYDRENQRLVLEQIYFSGRTRRHTPWNVIVAVDESGSMLSSVIHSAVMAGIFAKLPSHRQNGRSGGNSDERAAGRRHRHCQGHGVLPWPDYTAPANHRGAGERSVRRRLPAGALPHLPRHCRERRAPDRSHRAQ